MKTCKPAALILGFLLASAAGFAGEAGLPQQVSFSTRPTAAKDGDRVKTSFTVSAPTDVEVAVLDSGGRVVRHLVAGVLGGKEAPPEPLTAGLAQTVEWDGKDDAGKPAAGGPFKVRVRAGLRPEFDGFLLENPASTGSISSLAVGPKGSLYVFHHDPTTVGHWGSTKLKVLSREGKHERAVMPMPGNLSPEKAKAFGAFQSAEGDLVPRIHHLLRLTFYPDPAWRFPAQCPVVDSKGRVHWLVMGPAVASLDPDGSAPYEAMAGPKLLADIKELTMANGWFLNQSRPCLALSSDEKFLYLAGLTAGNPKTKGALRGVPCVFRIPLEKRDAAEPFLGKPGSPGTDKELLTGPRGLAVAGGLVYVADGDADRVAIFSEKDRTLVSEIKVKAPDSIGVDPATGAVYVCSMADVKTPDLIKFDKAGKEVCRLALPNCRHAEDVNRPHRIVVDASSQPVRICMPTVPYSTAPQLLVIEDAGGKFEMKGDPRDTKTPWAEGPQDLSYDRLRGELYVKSNVQSWYRVEEKTGKIQTNFRLAPLGNPNNGTTVRADAAGNLVSYSWSAANGLRLYDRNAKPLNWPGLASNHIPLSAVMNYSQRGMIIPNPDELFMIPPAGWRKGESTGSEADEPATCLNAFGLDGKVKRTVIWQCTKGAVPRLDAKGNIYLAEMVKPPDRSFPEFFDGKIKEPMKQTSEQTSSYYYSYMYGSIVKFPPSGGALWCKDHLTESVEGKPPAELLAKPKVPVRFHAGYSTQGKAELQGALWYRFGFAPYTSVLSSCMLTCMCEGGGFDVDPYGRSFYPNLGQFRVEVIDTNGNPVTMFGRYGNQDDGTSKGTARSIPLTWPQTVALSETHAYVADTLSRRVVKVKLAYAAEETCAVGP
ncbi:MAG TPA: hypothetical protein PK280_06205 [Planctomycetota bacterium]|nr:hypothetical protein [Planctomycetota bacterium]